MRIFISFEDVRLPIDVLPGQTVEAVKTVLKDHFKLNSSHAEGKIFQLQYAGAVLRDEWICSDIGITSGSTIKSALIDSDQPVLHIKCVYNGETIFIRDQLNFATTYVSQLTQIVSSKSGLPVSVFRLCTNKGKQMYNCHILDRYGVKFGSLIKLHVWDGWTDLLTAACNGHTRKVVKSASPDEQIAKFQFRVACSIAAHFDYVDLANSLINHRAGAVKPEEPVGQHSARLWSMASSHVDAWKSPVHEAVECGNVNVLRIFVQNNICCLVAKDGHGRTPMQVAFCYRQLECVQYLSSKLYSSYTENNVTLRVTIVIKTRKWCERARDRVLSNIGSYKSSMRRRPYQAAAIVGQGVIVAGFNDKAMNSRAKNYESVYAKDAECRIPGISLRSQNNENEVNKRELTTEDFHPDLNKEKCSYIQTPIPERTDMPSNAKESTVISRPRKVLIEGGIPLPALSVENHLRPFFHTSSLIENPVLMTLSVFEKYRQMTSRENAVQCMTLASTFKDKAWLRQVDLAVSLARRGVSNGVFEDTEMKASLPTIASSPIKVKE